MNFYQIDIKNHTTIKLNYIKYIYKRIININKLYDTIFTGHCPWFKVQCDNKIDCIPETWICDGNNDCPYGEDEYNCSKINFYYHILY